jgi:hypothetical protein
LVVEGDSFVGQCDAVATAPAEVEERPYGKQEHSNPTDNTANYCTCA